MDANSRGCEGAEYEFVSRKLEVARNTFCRAKNQESIHGVAIIV
jgi:hypothetical protein